MVQSKVCMAPLCVPSPPAMVDSWADGNCTITIFLGDAGAPIGPSFRTKKTSTCFFLSVVSTTFLNPVWLHFIILCLGRSIGAHSCSVASWPCPWCYSCLGSTRIDFSLSNLQWSTCLEYLNGPVEDAKDRKSYTSMKHSQYVMACPT